MAKYQKSIGGTWAKAAEIQNGTKARIISETTHSQSQFKDKEGNARMQDVAKVRFDGKEDTLNVNLNRATIYGLIDAFGEESKDWMNKVLTVHTEKVVVAGKRVTAMYLVPEGFAAKENSEGYLEIVRTGDSPADLAFDAAIDGEEEPIVE